VSVSAAASAKTVVTLFACCLVVNAADELNARMQSVQVKLLAAGN